MIPNEERNTRLGLICHARPTRGWKLFRSLDDSGPFGWVIAPRRPRDGIDRVRIELRLAAVLGVVGRFVTPAKSQIQSHVAEELPVVLNIPGMRPPSRQPCRDGLGELGIADRAKKECREGISCIGPERKIGGAETVRARGQRGRQRVVTSTNDFITELECVPVNNLGQIFLEGEVFTNVLRSGETAIILPEIGSSPGAIGLVVAGLEVGESQRAYIRNAELLGPVLSDGAGENCSAPAIVSETCLVDHRRTDRPRV